MLVNGKHRPRGKSKQEVLGGWTYWFLSSIVKTTGTNCCMQAEPWSGMLLIILSVVLWMKLISYHHCCADMRTTRRDGQVGLRMAMARWACRCLVNEFTA